MNIDNGNFKNRCRNHENNTTDNRQQQQQLRRHQSKVTPAS
jgi:hypothetical protein